VIFATDQRIKDGLSEFLPEVMDKRTNGRNPPRAKSGLTKGWMGIGETRGCAAGEFVSEMAGCGLNMSTVRFL